MPKHESCQEENEDTSVLETWYIEDANAVPSHFVLQPISSILVNFNNKVGSDFEPVLYS